MDGFIGSLSYTENVSDLMICTAYTNMYIPICIYQYVYTNMNLSHSLIKIWHSIKQ